MDAQLYVWSEPRDLDPAAAKARVDAWIETGADPAASPFGPSTDVAWFYRELTKDLPSLDTESDAASGEGTGPTWLATDDPPPAHVVTIHLSPDDSREDLETIFGLAAKYDLVLFDPNGPSIHRPLDLMAEHATATFWPRDALQAFVAGTIGLAIAVVGWYVGIPVVNWIAVLVGGFMVVMAVYTFIHEARRSLMRRDGGSGTRSAPG